MQVLAGCLMVTVLVSFRHLYTQVCTYCTVVYTCTWAHTCIYCAVVCICICTMYIYIVYMQVLNGCLAASNRQNWCPAASVYIYMCLQVCTVQLYAHAWTYAHTMYMYIVYMQVLNGCLASSNRQNWCPAASVYIYMYLQVCTVLHTHGLRHVQCTYRHIHSLRAGSGWVSHSDRHSWCPVGICIHVFTGVYCIVVYAHYDCVFV